MKKLPEIYRNSNIKLNKEKDYKKIVKETNDKYAIENKINSLFRSYKFVYKIKVEIETDKGVFIYDIVGKNNGNLITINNQLIPISSIKNIKEI